MAADEKHKLETRNSLDENKKPSTKDPAKKHEMGPIEKLIKTFVSKDINEVMSEVTKTRLIPDTKHLIANVLKDGVDMMFDEIGKGGTRSSLDRGAKYGGRRSERSNNNSSNANGGNRSSLDGASNIFDSRDYIFPNRGKTEAVLEKLRLDCDEYGKASVASFLSEAGYTSTWNDYDIGWTDLEDAVIRSAPGGYCIVMPKPISIKNL